MTKILTVIGARPQFIKASALSAEVRDCPGTREVIVHTGQHYDFNMSEGFFEELQIPVPKYRLDVGSGSHGVQTGTMLQKLDSILLDEKPDWLLVYGDTNSTLAGALSAAKLHIPVAHAEAGLRSFNRRMPEELNRIVADHLADLLFTPTRQATKQLQKEGIIPGKIHEIGDVMFDVANQFGSDHSLHEKILEKIGIKKDKFVLVTVHRAENTDSTERLKKIFEELVELSKSIPVVLPLHPRTRAALIREDLLTLAQSNLIVTEPKGFGQMVALEKCAQVVVTDSGGVQKEAFFQGTPCVTLRDETEWVELVDSGWNTLCPPTKRGIQEAIYSSLNSKKSLITPYGDGTAAKKLLDILRERRC